MTCKRCRSASSGTPKAHTYTHTQTHTGHCLLIGATDTVLSDRTRECRAPPVTRISRSHAAGLRLQVHDAIDHLDIQGARQPALHEPPMNQGLGAHDFVTPCRGVCHPPSLQGNPSMAMNSLFSLSSLLWGSNACQSLSMKVALLLVAHGDFGETG